MKRVAVVLGSCLIQFTTNGQPQRYIAEPIPEYIPAPGPRTAHAINAGGAVALSQPRHAGTQPAVTGAFVWSPGQLTLLDAVDTDTVPYDLNDAGVAAGSFTDPVSGVRAARMPSPDALVVIPTFDRPGRALAINNAGDVAGAYEHSPGVWHAFLHTTGGGTRDLGLLDGPSAVARDINDAGTVVGEATDLYGNSIAFMSVGGGPPIDLNLIATCDCIGFSLHSAHRITPGGLVAVNELTPGGQRAFIFESYESYGMLELRPLVRGDFRTAMILGLSDGDWTGAPVPVGVTAWVNLDAPTEVTYVATRWARSGGELLGLDLHERTVNPPAELFVAALDINAAGQIIVAGGAGGLYRLTPLCNADFNRDGFLDGSDYDEFTAAWQDGAPAADYNGDGFVDGVDYGDFMWGYESAEGCPGW